MVALSWTSRRVCGDSDRGGKLPVAGNLPVTTVALHARSPSPSLRGGLSLRLKNGYAPDAADRGCGWLESKLDNAELICGWVGVGI
jgi:hypothetical protein